jgi:trans-2,3-dihydro-3-hydroxyanthranilate isomerase
VTVALTREAGTIVGARIEVPRPLEIAHSLDAATVVACASLAIGDLKQGGTAPVMASVGLPFALVELESLQALARARADNAAFARADGRYPHPDDHFALYLFHREQPDRGRLRARMFAPLSNTPEDPATGSAAAALGAHLVSLRPEPDLDVELVVEQGIEMGRPSTIHVALKKAGGVVNSVQVGGGCVQVMTGSLTI